jgi:hypothetical protein
MEAQRVRGDIKGEAQVVLALGELHTTAKRIQRQRDDALEALASYDRQGES